ncbi:MAG: TIGR01244 family sulfur transferase [Pelagibacterium sp.]|uniref:TIGR01244 family sulfur transferase n=1 Tax=Pelagibacterium sp. TaxID=1967288 RepID=UPI0032EAFA6D
MNIKKIDDRFSTAGQITPDDIGMLKDNGFRAIVCARPDNEEPGQPTFAQIESAARAAGLEAFQVPVSGQLTEGQIIRFHEAMANVDGPVLGYCRSGARAGSLYVTLDR